MVVFFAESFMQTAASGMSYPALPAEIKQLSGFKMAQLFLERMRPEALDGIVLLWPYWMEMEGIR